MIALVVLDGWGLAPPGPGNAVALAHTPVMDRLWTGYPHTSLHASGADVGLPEGQMGNSEVGHLNLGAGRVVVQSLTRINAAIASGDFFRNPVLCRAAEVGRGARLHLIGLASEGGVHSSLGHLLALLELARREGVADVCVHAITDGRDTPPGSARGYLDTLVAEMRRLGVGRLATVMGRYYAMDRDRRWERTERAFRALVLGEGERAADHAEALERAARRRQPNGEGPETDEFLLPTVLGPEDSRIRAEDAVVCFNWRADRVRQLVRALTDPDFAEFSRPWPRVRYFAGMCPYDTVRPLPAAFPGMEVPLPLGEVVSRAGIGQLRLAETEKYAHVTYFFNGGNETPYPGEDRILVPSPKVATYDLQPEMSAAEVAARGAEAIRSGRYGLVVVNFANPDMVGHTGILAAAVRACEAADRGLGEILAAVEEQGGMALVLADHGNAEVMVDPETGGPHTAHTTNPVPCVLVGRPGAVLRSGGRLGDVAPTLLELLGLPQPDVMTGRSLLQA
jgi:2,3-bisphosphoglycerate-independent phosphoglycerate mutase